MLGFSFDAYVFFKLAGILWFVAAGYFALGSFKIPPFQKIVFLLLVVLCGFFTSKIWYIVQHLFGREPYPYDNFLEAWNDAGSVLYGWIFGGTAAVWAGSALLGWPVLKVLDALLPQMLVAQILNRVGCFIAGCCWGKGPCDLPWAVASEMAPGMRVHPVQIYEAAFDMALLGLLWALSRRRKEGERTFVYFVGYAIGRFILEFFRGDNLPVLLHLTVPQVTSVIIMVSALLIIKKILRSS